MKIKSKLLFIFLSVIFSLPSVKAESKFETEKKDKTESKSEIETKNNKKEKISSRAMEFCEDLIKNVAIVCFTNFVIYKLISPEKSLQPSNPPQSVHQSGSLNEFKISFREFFEHIVLFHKFHDYGAFLIFLEMFSNSVYNFYESDIENRNYAMKISKFIINVMVKANSELYHDLGINEDLCKLADCLKKYGNPNSWLLSRPDFPVLDSKIVKSIFLNIEKIRGKLDEKYVELSFL